MSAYDVGAENLVCFGMGNNFRQPFEFADGLVPFRGI